MQYTKSWQLRNAPVCYWGQLIGDVPLRIQSTYDVHCDSPATRNETTMFRCQEGASITEIDDVNQSREIHCGGTGKTKQCTDYKEGVVGYPSR